MTVTTDHDLTEGSDDSQSRRCARHLHATRLGPANVRAIIIFGALLFLAGCSDSPSEPEALAVVEQKIQRQSNGLIKLVSFQKTSRTEEIFGGMKTYQFQYNAEIEFTDDCIWTGGGTGGWHGDFEATRSQKKTSLGSRMSTPWGMQPAKKGQHQRVSGQVYFVKTENGWGLSN